MANTTRNLIGFVTVCAFTVVAWVCLRESSAHRKFTIVQASKADQLNLKQLSLLRKRATSPEPPTVLPTADYGWCQTNFRDLLASATRQAAHSGMSSCPDGSSPRHRLPDFIIIGEKKAGTSALLQFATLNKAVSANGLEPHYYDSPPRFACGREFYLSVLAPGCPAQLVGEKTPAYFRTPGVPEAISRDMPHTKFIVIFREPVERAVSDYLAYVAKMNSSIRKSSRDDHRVVPFERHLFFPNGSVRAESDIIRRSVYVRNLERWLAVFPISQFLFVESSVITSEPLVATRQVEEFLGVQDTAVEKSTFYFNKTRGFYCFNVHGSSKCLGKSKGRHHPDYNPLLLRRLAAYFKPYNEELFATIGITYDWPDYTEQPKDTAR